jgi:hypothetical protein
MLSTLFDSANVRTIFELAKYFLIFFNHQLSDAFKAVWNDLIYSEKSSFKITYLSPLYLGILLINSKNSKTLKFYLYF